MSTILRADEAHLWQVDPGRVQDQALLERYARLLAPSEVARWQRFSFAAGRHQYLVTRALVRTTLSRYCDVDPSAWSFEAGALGRPAVTGPVVPPFQFNLSHTDGRIVCLVSDAEEVGVDVEPAQRRVSLAVANRFFAPAEVEALEALPRQQRTERFFLYWTLKESYIKARGLGLTLPLRQFAFDFPGGAIRITFGPEIEDQPHAWQFESQRAGRHLIGISLRIGSRPRLQLRAFDTIPLA